VVIDAAGQDELELRRDGGLGLDIGPDFRRQVLVLVDAIDGAVRLRVRAEVVDPVDEALPAVELPAMLQLADDHVRLVHDRLARAQQVRVAGVAGVEVYLSEEALPVGTAW
jgi:hypothetical protein